MHRTERAGQVLLVAIQIRENVAGCPTITAIDRVIHAAVLFDERLYAPVARQPVLRSVVRARVLHDVLALHTGLIGDRCNAKLQPV